MSQVYEITDTFQDQLANFMGHEIRVHKNFYNLPLDLTQKARIAKKLISVNQGISLPEMKFEDLDIEGKYYF